MGVLIIDAFSIKSLLSNLIFLTDFKWLLPTLLEWVGFITHRDLCGLSQFRIILTLLCYVPMWF